MGDYNINIHLDLHSATAPLTCLLYSYSMLPVINWSTKISQRSATLKDNIFINNIDPIDKDRHGILVTDNMDHFPVNYINSCQTQVGSNEHICKLLSWQNPAFQKARLLKRIGLKCICNLTIFNAHSLCFTQGLLICLGNIFLNGKLNWHIMIVSLSLLLPSNNVCIARYHHWALSQRFPRGSCIPGCKLFFNNTTFSLKKNKSGFSIILAKSASKIFTQIFRRLILPK